MASVRNNKETASRDALRLSFSEALSAALVNRLGKVPSATYLANQFNFRANGTSAITRETARKWLTAQAIPEMPRLTVLVEWLGLDPHQLLTGAKKQPTTAASTGDDLIIETIVELLRKMDAKTRSVVLITAWALRETNSTPLGHLNLHALKRALLSSLTPNGSE